MSPSTGKFVWYELNTTDGEAATAFYRHVVGWEAKDAGLTDRTYTVLSAGPVGIGGILTIPENACDAHASPCWVGYVGVDDVDAMVGRVKAAGGHLHRAPEEIPGVGRFAVVADPHGAVFFLFRGASEQAPAPAATRTPGCIGWRELHAGNGESAFAFYSGLFGWSKAGAVDMGELGVYQLFTSGDEPEGGMMTKMPEAPAPFWLYYFNVPALDAAKQRVEERGGKVLMGPHQVPGGQWILQCTDPQGALFALLAPAR